MFGSHRLVVRSFTGAAWIISACGQVGVGVRTDGPSERVSVSSCCPENDAAIYAMLAQYTATPPETRTPELAILTHRSYNGVDAAARLVIRDPATWASTWARIIARSAPPIPTPAVDFGRDMLIFVAMGTRNSGGYVITIDSVTQNTNGLTTWVRETSPGSSCGTTAALTQPIAIARLARSDTAVVFHEEKQIRQCQ